MDCRRFEDVECGNGFEGCGLGHGVCEGFGNIWLLCLLAYVPLESAVGQGPTILVGEPRVLLQQAAWAALRPPGPKAYA